MKASSVATIIVIIIIIILNSPVFGFHGHWIDHYKSANDMLCCGTRDCLKTPMRLLDINDTHVTLDIKGKTVTILRKSFYLSEDTTDYLCLKDFNQPEDANNIRCAFIAVGS